jgi:hypothetical protein
MSNKSAFDKEVSAQDVAGSAGRTFTASVGAFIDSMQRLVQSARTDNVMFADGMRGFEALFNNQQQATEIDAIEKTLKELDGIEAVRRASFDGAMNETSERIKNLAAIKIKASQAIEQASRVAGEATTTAVVKNSFAKATVALDRMKQTIVGEAVELGNFERSAPTGEARITVGKPVPGTDFPTPLTISAADLKNIDFSFLAEKEQQPSARSSFRPSMKM